MDPWLVELFVCRSPAHRADTTTLTRSARLFLPDRIKKMALVVAPRDRSAGTLLAELGLHAFNDVRICRVNDDPATLDSAQLAEIFLTQLQAIDKEQTRGNVLCVSDISTLSVNVLGRIAGALGGTVGGFCEQIEYLGQGKWRTRKKAYGGRVELALELGGQVVFLALRGGTLSPPSIDPSTTATAGQPVVTDHEVAASLPPYQVDTGHPSVGHRDALVNAKLVMAGGRGMQSDQHYAVLSAVAEALGAALGGSLPAVDAGWVPVTRQIGQSGNYIKPDIYIAVGISGTPQHLAGVDPITRIVSINNDPDAALFLYSEVGVVADCRTFLPALLKEINRRAVFNVP